MLLLEKMLSVHRTDRQHQHIALYRDILEYYGYNLTPEQGFGISLGLGFEYVYEPNFRLSSDYILPGLYVGGFFSKDRRKLAKNLRIWLDVYRGDDPQKGFTYIYNYLKMGRPVIIECNLNKYWEHLKRTLDGEHLGSLAYLYEVPTSMYMNGFMLNVIGYDEEKKEIICQDPYLESAVRIPHLLFDEICFYQDEYIKVEGEWTLIVVPRHKNIINLEIAILDSIRLSVQEMLNPYKMDKGYVIGIDGLNKLLEHFEYWNEILTPYQLEKTIEMVFFNSEIAAGSTGLYRKIYAEFLKTSSGLLKNKKLEISAERYDEIGNRWSILLGMLHNSLKAGSSGFKETKPEARQMLQEVVDMEKKAIIFLDDILKELN